MGLVKEVKRERFLSDHLLCERQIRRRLFVFNIMGNTPCDIKTLWGEAHGVQRKIVTIVTARQNDSLASQILSTKVCSKGG